MHKKQKRVLLIIMVFIVILAVSLYKARFIALHSQGHTYKSPAGWSVQYQPFLIPKPQAQGLLGFSKLDKGHIAFVEEVNGHDSGITYTVALLPNPTNVGLNDFVKQWKRNSGAALYTQDEESKTSVGSHQAYSVLLGYGDKKYTSIYYLFLPVNDKQVVVGTASDHVGGPTFQITNHNKDVLKQMLSMFSFTNTFL